MSEALPSSRDSNEHVMKKIIFFIIATAVLAICVLMPTPAGLTVAGKVVLGVFLWYLIVLIGGCFPLGIIGVMAPALLVILKIYPESIALSGFVSKMSFLILGSLMFGAGMTVTNLGKRIALAIISFMKSSKVTKINTGMLIANLALCPFFPATVARGAFFYPIVKGVNSLVKGNDKRSSVLRSSFLMWGVGFAPIFVATMFLTGGMPAIMLSAVFAGRGVSIGWFEWIKLTIPLIGLLPILFLYFHRFYKLNNVEIVGSREAISSEYKALGKMTKEEIWLLIALFLALALWVLKPFGIDSGMAAILVATMIFLPVGLKYGWQDINKHFLWGTWIFLAGSISLAAVLCKSGVTDWLSQIIVSVIPPHLTPLLLVVLLMLGFQIARAGISSAVAMAACYIPLSISIAPLLGFNVLPFAILIVTVLSYSFILPFSIETVLIAWSAGDVSFSDSMKVGTPLTIIGTLYSVLVLVPWFALMGVPLW